MCLRYLCHCEEAFLANEASLWRHNPLNENSLATDLPCGHGVTNSRGFFNQFVKICVIRG